MIVVHALTERHVDDATTAIDLIAVVEGNIVRVTVDVAYDSIAFYDAAGARGVTVVVPPTKTARVSRRKPWSSARDRTIRSVKKHRTAQVEEDVGLPSASARGERLLQVQVDHRRWPSGPHARRASHRSPACVQRRESDD
ncbi:hypothetical protein JYU09_00320 [bacterium AH-315-O15]|nr:hypothetical protein [bacterium AH-315-O15]